MSMDKILIAEAEARTRLNNLREERIRLDEECKATLEDLNYWKRQAYLLGFTGNIMRDADGNRVTKLGVNAEGVPINPGNFINEPQNG